MGVPSVPLCMTRNLVIFDDPSQTTVSRPESSYLFYFKTSRSQYGQKVDA